MSDDQASASHGASWPARVAAALEGPAALRVAMALFTLALVLGLKRFQVWDQITTLEGAGIAGVFDPRHPHPHALRWLLMQPALALGRAGLDPHLAFTAMCALCLLGTALLLARAGARRVDGTLDVVRETALRVWLFMPLALLSLAMNGRLVPAFLGVALLAALHVERAVGVPRRLAWLVAGQLVGLLCCSVSSGAFAVGAAMVLWSWTTACLRAPRRWPLLIGALAAALALGGLGAALGAKALRYFSGQWSDLLGHGPAGLLLPHGAALTIAGMALWAAALTLWWWRWPTPTAGGSQVRVAAWAALLCGLVGYGTLVTAAPVLLLVAVLPLAGTRETRPA